MARALLSSLAVATLFAAALSPLACSSSNTEGLIDDSAEQGLKVGDCIEEVVSKDGKATGASCSDKGLVLDKDTSSSTGEVKHRCCKPSPTPIPGPVPGRCFGDSLGGPTSCKPVETWKLYATAICEKLGAKLTAQDFAEDCGGGTVPPPQPVASDGKTSPPNPIGGSFRYTKFVCCTDQGCTPVPQPTTGGGDKGSTTGGSGGGSGGGGSTKPPEPPICPPPPPPPPKCFGGGIATASPGPGGGTQPGCLSADDIKKQALAACESQGAQLTSLKLGGACANGGYSSGSWECCYSSPPPPPPPPPPPACFGGVIGDGKQCLNDVDIKKLAAEKCDASKATLTNLSYGTSCGIVAGSHFDAKFECCTGPTPVPPTPAPQPAPSK